ncbi:MAG TPA: hypothetical protein VM187_15035, partial [Niastella sp.]|nr:hypothetical protein [Niastella sp.]
MRICTGSSFVKRFKKGIGLFFLLAMIVCAGRTYGQDLSKKIALQLDSATVEQSITDIIRKSGLRLSVRQKLLAGDTKRVSVPSQQIAVGDALSLVLS